MPGVHLAGVDVDAGQAPPPDAGGVGNTRSRLAPAVGAKATTSRGDGVGPVSRSNQDPGRSRRALARSHVWRVGVGLSVTGKADRCRVTWRGGRSSWPVDAIVRMGWQIGLIRCVLGDPTVFPDSGAHRVYPGLRDAAN
jgi:hypothetical protein